MRDDLPVMACRHWFIIWDNYGDIFKVGLKDDDVCTLARSTADYGQRLGFHELTMIFRGYALCARIIGQ